MNCARRSKQHLEETQGHVDRLEQLAENLGEKLEKKTSKIMQSIIKLGEDTAKELKDSSALDAALIAIAQKAEHYEIAVYGTLSAWAEQMGHHEAVELLDETLEEEKNADQTLTSIAQSTANQKAHTA